MILIVGGCLLCEEVRSESDNVESFVTLSEDLKEAIDARNFQDAREVMDKLLPMMKEDLKESKKKLGRIDKDDESASVNYEKAYERKTELYETVKRYVELSSAALRVKSEEILDNVNEYVDLVEADAEVLVSE